MTDWIDTHQPLVTAGATAVLALAGLVLAVLVLRALRQGRRALVGAAPVIQPPVLVPGREGGLALEVALRNTSAWPAQDLRVVAKADRRALPGGVDGVSLFGAGAPGGADVFRVRFAWPVGVLDAGVRVRWDWHDGAGDHHALWEGDVRVPQPALPGEGPTGGIPRRRAADPG